MGEKGLGDGGPDGGSGSGPNLAPGSMGSGGSGTSGGGGGSSSGGGTNAGPNAALEHIGGSATLAQAVSAGGGNGPEVLAQPLLRVV